MDEIVKEVKKQWNETSFQCQGYIKAVEEYGKSRDMSGDNNIPMQDYLLGVLRFLLIFICTFRVVNLAQ